jgi:hypothetical protein
MWNALPVYPMYFNGQSRHFIWYMQHFYYLSRCEYGFIMFCIVFRVLNAIFIDISSKSFVILYVSFPEYVKTARFVFRCCGLVFSFCSYVTGCFLIRLRLYLLLRSMVLWHTLLSLSLLLLLDTYVIYLLDN